MPVDTAKHGHAFDVESMSGAILQQTLEAARQMREKYWKQIGTVLTAKSVVLKGGMAEVRRAWVEVSFEDAVVHGIIDHEPSLDSGDNELLTIISTLATREQDLRQKVAVEKNPGHKKIIQMMIDAITQVTGILAPLAKDHAIPAMRDAIAAKEAVFDQELQVLDEIARRSSQAEFRTVLAQKNGDTTALHPEADSPGIAKPLRNQRAKKDAPTEVKKPSPKPKLEGGGGQRGIPSDSRRTTRDDEEDDDEEVKTEEEPQAEDEPPAVEPEPTEFKKGGSVSKMHERFVPPRDALKDEDLSVLAKGDDFDNEDEDATEGDEDSESAAEKRAALSLVLAKKPTATVYVQEKKVLIAPKRAEHNAEGLSTDKEYMECAKKAYDAFRAREILAKLLERERSLQNVLLLVTKEEVTNKKKKSPPEEERRKSMLEEVCTALRELRDVHFQMVLFPDNDARHQEAKEVMKRIRSLEEYVYDIPLDIQDLAGSDEADGKQKNALLRELHRQVPKDVRQKLQELHDRVFAGDMAFKELREVIVAEALEFLHSAVGNFHDMELWIKQAGWNALHVVPFQYYPNNGSFHKFMTEAIFKAVNEAYREGGQGRK